MKGRIALVSAGLAALLALALALAPADLARASGYWADHPFPALLALLAYTAAFALRAFSWRPLVPARVPTFRLFALLMGALFLNHAAPAKAGDLARAYALGRRWTSTEGAVASVVLSRLVDLAALLVVLAASWTLAGAAAPKLPAPTVALPLALAAVAVALFILARRARLLARFGTRLGLVARFVGRARGALRGVTWAALLFAFVFAVPAWLLEAGILWAVARGLGLGLTPAELVAATCLAVLVAAVPLAPGSLGTYEAGMVVALVAFGVPPETAFAAAVTTHAAKFVYALAAAPFVLSEGLATVKKKEIETP